MSRYDDLAETFLSYYDEGLIVPKKLFYGLFGLEEPKDGWRLRDIDRQALRFANDLEGLRKALLRRGHDLQNARGKGYYIVPFHDRPKTATEDSDKMIWKGIREGMARLKAIPHPEQLTGEAKRVMDNGMTKLGFLRSHMREARRMQGKG